MFQVDAAAITGNDRDSATAVNTAKNLFIFFLLVS
jgi:hypothetical protein